MARHWLIYRVASWKSYGYATNVIERIAQTRPLYAVLRDASLADDSAAVNFGELFRTYSPDPYGE